MSRFRALTAILVAVAVTAVPAATARAPFTVVEHKEIEDGKALDIACNERVTLSFGIPGGARNVEVLEPRAGDPVIDGFGQDRLGTIESVVAAERQVDVTVVGGYTACSGPGAWRTNGIDFRAQYERVLTPRVVLSEEPGGLDARQKPKAITATADAGWSGLKWKRWGSKKAVAKGKFYGVRAVDPTGHHATLKTFKYPVKVKLTKIRACAGGYYYSKLATEWLRSPHPEIRRQAKVPSVAECLHGG